MVQRHVVLDVVGNQRPIFLRHGFEIARGEDGIGRKLSEVLLVNDVPDEIAARVSLEVSLDRGERFRFLRFIVGDELGELFLEQVVLRFEARDEAEDLFKNLAE